MGIFIFTFVMCIVVWVLSWLTFKEEDFIKRAKKKVERLEWKMYKEKRKAHDLVTRAENQIKKAQESEDAYFNAFHDFLGYKGESYDI